MANFKVGAGNVGESHEHYLHPVEKAKGFFDALNIVNKQIVDAYLAGKFKGACGMKLSVICNPDELDKVEEAARKVYGRGTQSTCNEDPCCRTTVRTVSGQPKAIPQHPFTGLTDAAPEPEADEEDTVIEPGEGIEIGDLVCLKGLDSHRMTVVGFSDETDDVETIGFGEDGTPYTLSADEESFDILERGGVCRQ